MQQSPAQVRNVMRKPVNSPTFFVLLLVFHLVWGLWCIAIGQYFLAIVPSWIHAGTALIVHRAKYGHFLPINPRN